MKLLSSFPRQVSENISKNDSGVRFAEQFLAVNRIKKKNVTEGGIFWRDKMRNAECKMPNAKCKIKKTNSFFHSSFVLSL